MHPQSRHRRPQSCKDLDDAVSKLEHAREVLLDAKVKTNEALSKAALTMWQHECRRAPRTIAPEFGLTSLVARSRQNSPASSPRNNRAHTLRSLAVSQIQTQAHISHQSVVYSPKLKRLEINQTLSTVNTLAPSLLPNVLSSEVSQSIEHKIRRRQQSLSKAHQHIVLPYSSSSSSGSSESYLKHSSELCGPPAELERLKNRRASSSQKEATTCLGSSSTSSSRSTDRKSTLSDIRSLLQNLQEQLYFVPASNQKILKADLSEDFSLSKASSNRLCDSGRCDLKYLDSKTRDVLRALSKRCMG